MLLFSEVRNFCWCQVVGLHIPSNLAIKSIKFVISSLWVLIIEFPMRIFIKSWKLTSELNSKQVKTSTVGQVRGSSGLWEKTVASAYRAHARVSLCQEVAWESRVQHVVSSSHNKPRLPVSTKWYIPARRDLSVRGRIQCKRKGLVQLLLGCWPTLPEVLKFIIFVCFLSPRSARIQHAICDKLQILAAGFRYFGSWKYSMITHFLT